MGIQIGTGDHISPIKGIFFPFPPIKIIMDWIALYQNPCLNGYKSVIECTAVHYKE